jgi:tetratricopeptide (TPR) repeat protein
MLGILMALALAGMSSPSGAEEAVRAGIAPETPIAKQTMGQLATAQGLLRAGMRQNLQADYEAARSTAARIGQLHPNHPAGPFLETQTLYWKMLYDDANLVYDEAIEKSCLRTIELAEALLDANDDDPAAHFFAGQGYMDLGRLRGFRGSYYAAGKAGEESRKHLERALELRPDWVDARYQLGAYYFYASLIPKMVTKWLGWLWFVPMGNAELGIAYIAEVAERGDIFKDDATLVLSNIYTYFRKEEIATALRMIRDMHERYPENALIHFELVETLLAAHEYDEVIEQALLLEGKPTPDERWAGRQTVANIWRARAELMLGRPERTLELLAPMQADPPTNPHWASAWVDLTHGHTQDVLGNREQALDQYRAVLAYEEPFGSRRAKRFATAAMSFPFVLPDQPEISAAP